MFTEKKHRQAGIAEQVENEVMEFTKKLVKNPKFVKDLEGRIGNAIDLTEVEREIKGIQTHQKKLERSCSNLESDIDNIDDSEDAYASRRRADMKRRLDNIYTELYQTEDALQAAKLKLETLRQENLNVQTIYSLLSSFDKIYDKMSRAERRSMIKYMIAEVQLYMPNERKEKGCCCKSITYRFPIEQAVLDDFNDKGVRVETVVRLSQVAD